MLPILSLLVVAHWAAGTHAATFPYESCSLKQVGSSPYYVDELTLPKTDRLCMRFGMKKIRGKRCTKNYATSLELEINSACDNAAYMIAMAAGTPLDVEVVVRNASATSSKTLLILSGSQLTRCLERNCKVCLYLLGTCSNLPSLVQDVRLPSLALVDTSRACCSVMPLNITGFMPPAPTNMPPPTQRPAPPKQSSPAVKPSPAPSPAPSPKPSPTPSPSPRPSPSPASKPSPYSSMPPPTPNSPGSPSSPSSPPETVSEDIAGYNLVMGTQQFNPKYGFSGKSGIVEAADVIVEMGSNILKMHTDVTKYPNVLWKVNGVDFSSPSRTLKDVFSKHPDMVNVLDRSELKFYLFWTYVRTNEPLTKGFEGFATNKAAQKIEYQEMYDATLYLLNTYQGTGKTFFLGNWEGDWMLKAGLDSPAGPAGMVAWVNTRQAAVDAAKKDAKVSGVEVYFYLEVNLVEKAIDNPSFGCVSNLVLPYVNPDFVSYSCYDSITGSGPPRDVGLTAALKFLSRKLKPKVLSNGLKPGTPAAHASRVFIGEYGFASGSAWTGKGLQYNVKQVTDNMRQVVRVAFQQRVSFVLYWQLYNNQVDEMGNHRGWWLIDNKGNKTPMYWLHQKFLSTAHLFITSYKANTGYLPSREEFNRQALDIFNKL